MLDDIWQVLFVIGTICTCVATAALILHRLGVELTGPRLELLPILLIATALAASVYAAQSRPSSWGAAAILHGLGTAIGLFLLLPSVAVLNRFGTKSRGIAAFIIPGVAGMLILVWFLTSIIVTAMAYVVRALLT